MLPKAPGSELKKNPNLLAEAARKYKLIHIEANVVHVDLVLQGEVTFKLTPQSIAVLTEHHKGVYLIDAAASMCNWPGKETQLKKLQENFVQSINKFVYCTSALALEVLEGGGGGELLCGRPEDCKNAIMNLFLPLLPPLPSPDLLAPRTDGES